MAQIKRSTVIIILAMIVLVLFTIIFSQTYYNRINSSVDPRITSAREMYSLYNELAEGYDTDTLFLLLDSVGAIYSAIPHYENSFEKGVLHNNRAAIWLTKALYSVLADSTETDSLVLLAEQSIRESMDIYIDWLSRFKDKERGDIRRSIETEFLIGLEDHPADNQETFLDARSEELDDARMEVPRRLSVSLTNLGIVCRYRQQYDSAAACYVEALKYWDRNLAAKNNLNLLLGKPLEKQGLIQKLFPPERL